MFALKGNAVTDPHLKAVIKGNALSTVESVTNLGVTLTNNAKWATHVEEVCRKRVHLSFFVMKFLSLSKPDEFICKCITFNSLLFFSHLPWAT